MNPLTNMRNVKKLSEQELQRLPKSSWHDEYKSSAWIFVGGLPYDLSEGDIMSIFSQYGEITNLNLVRDKDTGKQKGFCFVCYEDQRSTILAVDNFNGTRVLGRILRVDHVKDYKPPKNSEPTNKIKTEKFDDDFQVKTEIKEEILSPQVRRTIETPEIKQEVYTPEIKREVCTPEIIKSPVYKSNKSPKKSKDKKRYHSDKSKEKDDIHYKYQREDLKEKHRKKHSKSEQDIFYKKDKSHKRSRHSQSQEKDISKNSKGISSKDYNSRDKSRERDRKKIKDDRREYDNKDYDDKNKRKSYQKDDRNYKKQKKY
ncbi:U2 snRNP component ist3 [Melanaphis sacchari]|uniref:U2 snRNP component ist3 n=1 Tax=Melanaphis sacchari TaxID=742174 RepID=UPI000DC14BC7|nr:U2 snRNP component ist3 [Melanaphis sacchari]